MGNTESYRGLPGSPRLGAPTPAHPPRVRPAHHCAATCTGPRRKALERRGGTLLAMMAGGGSMRPVLALSLSIVIATFAACSSGTGSSPGPVGRGCTSAAQCSGIAPNCVAGSCSACEATCPMGEPICVPSVGCVECNVGSDCGAGSPFCIDNRCRECQTNLDCPASAPACEPRDHRCRPACTTAMDCSGDAPICDTNMTCVGCRTSADCMTDRPVCDAQSQQCVECAGNADCGAGQPFCVGSRCRECRGSTDCPLAQPVCNADLECQDGCLSNADCPDMGRPLCNLDRSQCVQCLTAADCGDAGLICQNGECRGG